MIICPAPRPLLLSNSKKFGLLVQMMLILGLMAIGGSARSAEDGRKSFDFNPRCQQAYQEIVRLRIRQGKELLNLERRDHPDNLIPVLLENYIDFFQLFFNENPEDYARLKANEAMRLESIDEGLHTSPYYEFSKAVIHFQWAAVKIKFSHNWDAGWEFRRSYLQASEVLKNHPGFFPARMMHGAMQAVAGTIPDGYRWLSNLLGIRGSIRVGMEELETVLNESDSLAQLFHNETVFYYLYLKFYIENKKADVFRYIRTHRPDTESNLLLAFMISNLSINGQRSADAEKVILARPGGPGYLAMPVWNMQMGVVRLNHLEPDAGAYLEKFLHEFKGNFYVQDVLQRLSWCYYLSNDKEQAVACRKKIIEKGGSDTEADRQALQDARSGKWPNVLLLKARLLNDGGYNQEALAILQGKSSSDFESEEEKLEFAYRLARIYDDLGRTEEALGAYLTTIKLGQDKKAYYAARAALQSAYIYERRGDRKTAVAFFQKVIALKDHDYKNSLDQKAKAGIQRCSE
jgi:hypothetical protein